MDNEKLFMNTPDLSLINHYYLWLQRKVDTNHNKGYSKLLRYLRSKEFYYSVPNDVNRAEDGKHLRREYLSTGKFLSTDVFDDEPCSVLEMIIALSERLNNDIMPDYGYGTPYWFWRMIGNLGLDFYTDDRFEVEKVDEIVKNWLDRSYHFFLKSGKILIKSGKIDRKFVEKTEIWYQMMAWVEDEFE